MASDSATMEIQLDDSRRCPGCGDPLGRATSLIVAYWRDYESVYFCYCANCGWEGEIVEHVHHIAYELSEE
ncbi:hypothetical protein [Alicyclobacillus fastidiosus]|uniref:Uncharacterized protein n=1 Tax=Alicyclobacillus fastidiosus TaxID=392011 RepID=A0ABV5AL61_9BACL|nr:hypothetical protein [Alicyclobacillus fastidiosus]WEH09376.1 hypothetical protein PYS47_22445 [Alicyclobacillus fastidiosus]